MNKKRFLAAVLILISLALQAYSAGFYGRDIPDSSEIRNQIIDKWFFQDLAHLRMQESELYENNLGQKFQVRLEELEDSFAIVVAPHTTIEVDIISDEGTKTSIIDVYPYDLPGSWILFRDKETGNPLSVRYYFLKNSEIYVEFKNNMNSGSFLKKKGIADKVYGNFVLYDMYVAQGIPVGLSIQDLYKLSFLDIVEITGANMPWKYAALETYRYDDSLQMVGFIREKIEKMVYADDACYDGELKPIKVSDGSSRKEKAKEGGLSLDNFGFTKWIVDGLVRPISGSNLELEPLKRPTIKLKTGSKADTLSDKYNIFFGLDWTRNLAAAYLSVISDHVYTFENSGCEVTTRPFASQYTISGTKTIPVYIKDSGYSTDCLKALFYTFAVQEPGRFYLGAIRETDDKVPQNAYYARTAAFFPYFDAEGNYFVSVFENGKEYSIDEFIKNNPGTFVNLVRLQSSQRFFPQ
ncbi:MAG: hypothetical protein K5839_05055 [Treponemataceae bacterium]|nr:hypothetical protein [Treponemataceae bacterium]